MKLLFLYMMVTYKQFHIVQSNFHLKYKTIGIGALIHTPSGEA